MSRQRFPQVSEVGDKVCSDRRGNGGIPKLMTTGRTVYDVQKQKGYTSKWETMILKQLGRI